MSLQTNTDSQLPVADCTAQYVSFGCVSAFMLEKGVSCYVHTGVFKWPLSMKRSCVSGLCIQNSCVHASLLKFLSLFSGSSYKSSVHSLRPGSSTNGISDCYFMKQFNFDQKGTRIWQSRMGGVLF